MTTTGVTYNHKNGHFWQMDFTGKELDLETGYSYFGARYLENTLTTLWLSVDPMADKYPSISPYAYCAWNPLKLVDPDGEEVNPIFSTEGKLLGTDDEGYGGEAIVMDKSKFQQGMSHDLAEQEGHYLSKYGEGIRISDKDWKTVVNNGGERLIPTVSNESDYTIYYKPEGVKGDVDMNPGYFTSNAYPIPPHTDLYASTDGIAAPHIKKGKVFKMPDGLKVRITNQIIYRRIVSSKKKSLGASFIPFKGGWNGDFWHDYLKADFINIHTVGFSKRIKKESDRDWDALFNRSN
ncbi:MAG: hypothetical protein K5864_05120 [Bacteroidales bacterium]|nr:hypothetical protein [Bacteroidales bacterium]